MSEASWAFEGLLLPDGTLGAGRAGSGPRARAAPGFALTGLVDADCHLAVADDLGVDGLAVIA
jgi:hypothetical protein